MAEPVGIASGVLTLATFAFQSSITLYQTVRSFRHHPNVVRDLMQELEALSGVLASLTETVTITPDRTLAALDIPLRRCGDSCREFEEEILKCSSRSSEAKTSFRDWAKLRYMGEDIDGFRRLLAGYKSTINIALADANLRKSTVTADALESYTNLLETTTTDLEVHLESIDKKLEIIFNQSVTNFESDTAERQLIQEEQSSTRRCLEICNHLSEHISQIQLDFRGRGGSAGPEESDTFSKRITNVGLQECRNDLSLVSAKLESHLRDLMDRLVTKSKTAMTSSEDAAELVRLRDHWESTRQCLDICTRADQHVKENISDIDNYATGDAVQFMVSTNDKVIHGRNRGLGWRTRQVGGHIDSVSLRQISQDIMTINIKEAPKTAPASQTDSSSVPPENLENVPNSAFQARHGQGFKLAPKSGPDSTPSQSSTGAAGHAKFKKP